MKESTLWFLFILAGALIVVLVGIHMVVMHLDKVTAAIGLAPKDRPEVLSHESVLTRSRNIFHVIIYMLLLATALFHGLYGFRSIVYELPISAILRKATDVVVTLAGMLFFIWGAIAIIMGYISQGG
jgi:succinate dehydrogenase hydrophobic anchor subunit